MNYFTATISVPLAEKLKEKGMPIRIDHDTERTDATFGACIDWLMEKGILIIIKLYWNTNSWESYVMNAPEIRMPKDVREIYVQHTWHEAAEAAIEKALKLI